MDINFRDIRQLQRQLESAAEKKFPRYLRRAFFSTVRASKTQAKRAIAKTYNLPQKRIAKDLRTGNVRVSAFTFSVLGNRQPVGLASYSGTRRRKTGVSAKIKKSAGRKLYKSAWVGHGLAGERQGGAKLVFRRIPGRPKRRMSKGRYAGSPIRRQPIQALKGPSVGAMLENDDTVNDLVTFAAGKYSAELNRLLKVALRNGP